MTVACQVILGKEHHGGLSFGNTKIKHRKKLGVAIMKRFFALFLAFILLFWVIGLMVGCAQKPPAITIVDPDMASLDGGSEITITAIGLKRNSVPTVTIGGNLATDVKFLSKWSLSAIIPPSNTAGPADIVVQNAKAKVKSLPFKGFFYYEDVVVKPNIPDTSKQKKETQKKSQVKNIVSRYDDMEDVTWYHVKGSEELEKNSIYDVLHDNKDEAVCINAYIGKQKDNVWMRCRCKIVADSWLFTTKIVFLVDGKRIEWPFDDAKTDVYSGGHIKESVDFDVDDSKENDILAIAKGKDVKVRFSGTRRNFNYVLTNKQKKDLFTVVSYYEEIK